MNEQDLVALAWKILKRDEEELLGLDDAQAVDLGGGSILVLNVDVFDETTDWLPGMTLREVGWKAVVAAVSDVLVKGAKPLGLLLGLGLPEDSVERVGDLFKGVQEACEHASVSVWGGDIGRSENMYLAVTAVGLAERVVARRGARPGDALMLAGRVGLTPVAYAVLLEGAPACRGFEEALRAAYRPELVKQEFWLRAVKHVTAAIDNSDGLALSLHYLAEASGVRLVVERLPVNEVLAECAEKWGLDPLELLLYSSGEEYSFIFTVEEEHAGDVKRLAAKFGVEAWEIGRVEEGSGVYVKGLGDVERRGWDSLKARFSSTIHS